MKDLKSKFEVAVNVLIAVAVVTVAGITVKRYLSQGKSSTKAAQGQIGVGSNINVPGVNWESNKRTMIFFLKKDCQYCTSSAPFFRELIAEAQQRRVPVLAILPHQVQEARDYLTSLNLSIDNVQTGSLSSYQVPGTPTVVLVDATGRVMRAWIGAVAPDRQESVTSEFISSVEAEVVNNGAKAEQAQSTKAPQVSAEVDPAELKQVIDSKAKVVVIDVDQRDDFKKEHIPDAMNIPADELAIRAARELAKESTIVLYCRCKDSRATVEAQARLREQGFSHVSVVKGGLASWKERGMPVKSSE